MSTIVIDTPEGVYMFRLTALKGALALERIGLKRRGRSAYSIIKREFGFRGNKERVYTQFCEFVEKERGRLGF